MSIDFLCQQCGAKIRCPDEAAGQKALCPHCENISIVPHVEVSPASQTTTPQQPPGSVNPFQAPTEVSDQQFHQKNPITSAIPRSAAVKKVLLPSVGIMIFSALCILTLIAALAWLIFDGANRNARADFPFFWASVTIIACLWDGIIFYGASRMRKLDSYWFTVTACLMAMLEGFCVFMMVESIPEIARNMPELRISETAQTFFKFNVTFILLRAPFALWGMTGLLNNFVRRHFTTKTSNPMPD